MFYFIIRAAESFYQWWAPAMNFKIKLLWQLRECFISVWICLWDLTSRHNYSFSCSSFLTKKLITALEEAVSKGRCVVALAQQQSWIHVLPLSDLSTLVLLGKITGARLCLGQEVLPGTPWVSCQRPSCKPEQWESPRASDRLCVLPSASGSQSPWLALAGLRYGSSCFDIASVVYICLWGELIDYNDRWSTFNIQLGNAKAQRICYLAEQAFY